MAILWKDNNFTCEEANEWEKVLLPEEAKDWRDMKFSIKDAILWKDEKFTAKEAREWIKIYKNITPVKARKLRNKYSSRTPNEIKQLRYLVTLTIISFALVISILGYLYLNTFKNNIRNFLIEHNYFQIAKILDNNNVDNIKKIIILKNMIKNNATVSEIKYFFYKNKNTIDLNKQDEDGKTILHYAFEYAKLEVIKKLIELGAKEYIITQIAS